MAGFSSPSLRTLVRHYSYYTQPEGRSPITATQTHAHSIPKAASLLMHTLALDAQQQETVSECFRIRWCRAEYVGAMKDGYQAESSCSDKFLSHSTRMNAQTSARVCTRARVCKSVCVYVPA